MRQRRLFWLVFAVLAMVIAVIQFVPADSPGLPAAESEETSPRGQAEGHPRRPE